MKWIGTIVVATAAIALSGGSAAAGTTPAPQQFCQVQFVSGGPLYAGVGIRVVTPAGNSLTVCRVRVAPPPETIVSTFPGSHGDIFVMTQSGMALVVFH